MALGLERMLNDFSSLVSKASGGIRQVFVDETINFYEQSGEPLKAARIADNHGRTERAIGLYLLGGNIPAAAFRLARLGNEEEAIGLFEQSNLLMRAAEFAEACAQEYGFRSHKYDGLMMKSLELYEKAEALLPAADIAGKLCLYDKQRELYAKEIASLEFLEMWDVAIMLAQRTDLRHKAIRSYIEHRALISLPNSIESVRGSAGTIMREPIDFEKAAEEAIAEGKSAKAKKLYRLAFASYSGGSVEKFLELAHKAEITEVGLKRRALKELRGLEAKGESFIPDKVAEGLKRLNIAYTSLRKKKK